VSGSAGSGSSARRRLLEFWRRILKRQRRAHRKRARVWRGAYFETLESRVLLSGGFEGALVDTELVTHENFSQAPIAAEVVSLEALHETGPADLSGLADLDHEMERDLIDTAKARELVFVDENIADYEELIADLQRSDETRAIKVALLESDRNGIEQASEILSENSNLTAVHFITHGADGQIALGNTFLNSTTLEQNTDAISAWGNALTETGDMLFYGCNTAAGSDGQSLLDRIAKLSGADVAASDDGTGQESLGGDWQLEVNDGQIETALAPSATFQQHWNGLLNIYTVTNTNNSGGGSLRQAITDANGAPGADTIRFAIGSGAQTISLTSALPQITDQVTIDGSTQPGFAGSPLIRIDGASAGAAVDGFSFSDTSDGSIIRGLMVTRFTHDGILIQADADNITVAGNWLGTDGSGETTMGNANHGIEILGTNATIGGTGGSDRNVITNNGNTGVRIAGGSGNSVLGNRIYSNTGLGIDIDAAGVTLNDPNDADSGVNHVQNFPVLTSAVFTGAQLNVIGNLNTTTNCYFHIEFFASTSPDNTGNYGEGQTYLGFVNVTTDGSGNATFSAALTASIATGIYITATATESDATFTAFSDSSEFSAYWVANTAPTLDPAKNPTLTAENEDSGAPSGAVGTLVSSLVDFATPAGQVDNVTDPDPGAQLGIAVTAADTSNGSWYYSTNNGTNWNALGAMANNNARLLAADSNTRLYFRPDADYNGTLASAISFRAWDQTSGTNGASADTTSNGGTTAFSTATDSASLTIDPVNDAPVLGAIGDQTVDELVPLTFTATATDSDLPADTLTFTLDAASIDLGMSIDANTGVFSWTPTEAQGGLTPSVTITVTDNGAGHLTDSETFTITVSDINVAPVITSANAANVAENTTTVLTVTATDADLPVQTVSFSITGGADSSKFSIDTNTGELTFQAAPDYENPTDADTDNVYVVQVTANDGAGLTTTQTINVTVTGVNEAPVGNNDTATTYEFIPITFNVVSNDTDPEGDTLVVSAVTQGANGTVTFAGGSVTYTPNANFSGLDSFTYTVSDGNGGTSTATIRVTVTPVITETTTPTETEDQTLSEGTSGISDTKGLGAINLQSMQNEVANAVAMNIFGETDATPSHGSTGSAFDGSSVGMDGKDPSAGPFGRTKDNPIEAAIKAAGTEGSTGSLNQTGPLEALKNELNPVKEPILEPFSKEPQRHALDAEAMISNESIQRELDGLKQQLEESLTPDELKEKLIVGMASGIGSTFFVGYVMWALRGTSLLASALASLPVWRCFDPLTVLPAAKRRRRKHDTEREDIEKAPDNEENVEELFSPVQGPRRQSDVKGTGT
jgi:hypothetical protein